MQPDVTKNWTVSRIAIRILEQADGERKAWFSPSNYVGSYQVGDGEVSADELRQMAAALSAAAEHLEPMPDPRDDDGDRSSTVSVSGDDPTVDAMPAHISSWADRPPAELRLSCVHEAHGDVELARALYTFVRYGVPVAVSRQ